MVKANIAPAANTPSNAEVAVMWATDRVCSHGRFHDTSDTASATRNRIVSIIAPVANMPTDARNLGP